MILKTERLIIRPWTLDDLPHYKAMSIDVGYNCFSPPGIFLVKDENEAAEKIKARIKLFEESRIGKFLIFEKSSGDFVGTCGADFFDLDGAKEVELGYRVMLAHWGKGYATESAKEVVSYLLEEVKLKSVFGFALNQNKQSVKILKKIGFKFLREFMWFALPHQLFEIKMCDRNT